ncbi:MAG: ABC transporter permease [Bacillota bacterium]
MRYVVKRLLASSLGVVVLSVVLSLVALCACALAAGANPLTVLAALAQGALQGRYAVLATCAELAAITLCGLAVLIPFRAGFFNIGGQGQLEAGALAAVTVALQMHLSPWITIPAALVAASLVGALTVVVPLVLRLRRGASEVTTTIMMNFACVQFMYAMVTGPMKDPRAFYGTTPAIPEAYRLPVLAGGVHAGIWLSVALAVVLYMVLKSTVFGLHVSAVGGNRSAALAAGIPVDRVMARAVLLGAALAGLAGGVQVLGLTYRVAEGWSKSWGFTGIPVALLGGNPLGVLLVGFVFAVLETGSRSMQAATGVPAALIYLFQGLPVLIFLALNASAILRRGRQQS